jgi:ankyrin repeat protein
MISNEEDLITAFTNKNLQKVKDLLKIEGINVNYRENIDGNTPLHYESIVGNTEIIDLLLKKGANINEVNRIGLEYTPLHNASRSNKPLAVKMLLVNGADYKKINKYKGTALDIALHHKNKNQDIISKIISKIIENGAYDNGAYDGAYDNGSYINDLKEAYQYQYTNQDIINMLQNVDKLDKAIEDIKHDKNTENQKKNNSALKVLENTDLNKYIIDYLGGKKKTNRKRKSIKKRRKTNKRGRKRMR